MDADRLRALLRRNPGLRTALGPALAARQALLALRRRPLRSLHARLCAVLAEDPVLRVGEFAGDFAVDPRSDLFVRLLEHGHYEPKLAAAVAAAMPPDRDAIDVGANIGFYSVLLARRTSGRVLAVEPTAAAHRRLVGNLRRNGVAERVIVFHGAVAERAGTVRIHAIEGKEEYSAMGGITHHAVRGARTVELSVPADSIDGLIERHGLRPGLIKIDTEGAEHLVLAGAIATLRSHRPAILCEIGASTPVAVAGIPPAPPVAWLRSLGCAVHDPWAPGAKLPDDYLGDVLATWPGR